MSRYFVVFSILIQGLICLARGQENLTSGLNAKQFDKYWKVESESPAYKVKFFGDTVEITAPKGLTLWRMEKMHGSIIIEYDACVVVENENDRLSDLNCFWMASDPKSPDDLWKNMAWRSGIFVNCYSLQLYYLGYGGNSNTTTRFRRYDGNEAGITNDHARPAILREYTDSEHLLTANHWYHIKLVSDGERISYYIDGKRIIDYRDPSPLTEGWFGFRTTWSRTRITNFKYEQISSNSENATLQWIGKVPQTTQTVSFGVPFNEGELLATDAVQLISNNGENIEIDTWPMAYWPDGSLKWIGTAAVVPPNSNQLTFEKQIGKRKYDKSKKIIVKETDSAIEINSGVISAYIPKYGNLLIDSILYNNTKVCEASRLIASTQSEIANEQTQSINFKSYASEIKSAQIERAGNIRALVKLTGVHRCNDGREWLPFVVRLYFYYGSEKIKMVHSFIYDGDQDQDFICALGVRFDVPMRDELYNRHIAFSTADSGVWSEPIQPLVGRQILTFGQNKTKDNSIQQRQMLGQRIPPYDQFDTKGQNLIDNWASWDSYRISQLSADAFTIRKRANRNNPWIGTYSGQHSNGYTFLGDISGGIGILLHDFWQSYPSTVEVSNAKTDNATLTVWLWSPEAEPMDLRHYDNRAHDLIASYEDVQEGMSTPFGIARTSTITICCSDGYKGKNDFAAQAAEISQPNVLLPIPEYLHSRRAFGIWSLPDRSNAFRSNVEDILDGYIDFYIHAIEDNKWYGFWNYGDVMHAYDNVRHTWRYDIGGYAWDNTELASNMWLWYNFLRTGRADIWRMAEAMTRHTCEVDVYHIGKNAGLGSRHNVNHWGCGAKEVRVSQAAWNHFYYYLTTDERCGDLMSEVKDVEQQLYDVDPMRLAQPKNEYPCTAPARLRIGPDWIALASNWLLEWERTQNSVYRDKIIAGMNSLCALPNRLFTGPLALGFDPATCIITSESDPQLQSTNHLMTIMGGFEMMNQIMRSIKLPEWEAAWLDFTTNYKQKALEIKHNRFRISRLQAYAAYQLKNSKLALEAWQDLMNSLPDSGTLGFQTQEITPPDVPSTIIESPGISTNDAATWSLDAIYMQDVIPMGE